MDLDLNEAQAERELRALDPAFQALSDRQVHHFESQLKLRAYIVGVPEAWILEFKFPPTLVLAALKQTLSDIEAGAMC